MMFIVGPPLVMIIFYRPVELKILDLISMTFEVSESPGVVINIPVSD